MKTRRLTGRLARLGTVSISALTVAALAAAPAHADPADPALPSIQPAQILPLPPELDPGFYNPPAEVVAAKAPGEIIAARQVNVANFGLIPLNVDAWQVSYRSNNGR